MPCLVSYAGRMPNAIIVPDEHYHIYNRGHNKQTLFFDRMDYVRMLFYLLFLQAPIPTYNTSRMVGSYLKKGYFSTSKKFSDDVLKNRSVHLEAFALMPNHFHLTVHELTERGISEYLRKVEIAYTKYFNIRYKRFGYLFQGPFQSVHVETNEQLLHLSAYIHHNIRDISQWKRKEDLYPWSSYQDYVHENRWDELLDTSVIMSQFKKPEEYKDFVKTSGTKESHVKILD